MPDCLTIGQVLEQWVHEHSLGRKPKTARFYAEIGNILRAAFGDLLVQPVSDMRAQDVLALGTKLQGLCASRWNAAVGFIRTLSPLLGKLLRRRPIPVREFSPPAQDQFELFLAECDGRSRELGLIVRFLCFSGLRFGEARALRWEHIGADGLRVPPGVSKNGKGRFVPLNPALRCVVEELRSKSQDGYVLPRCNPKCSLKQAARRTGLGNWSWHTCRHFFASRAVMSGVDLPTLARWLGHQDGGALLARVYFHLADQHSRQMAERLRF